MGAKRFFKLPLKNLLIIVSMLIVAGCQPVVASDNKAISGLRLNNILGEPQDQGFSRAQQSRDFIFPVDHGPHNRYRSEWWYLTAVLEDEAGNEYGTHFTLFRQALSPEPTGFGPWNTAQAYLGHLAVTDVSKQAHYEAERFARGHPELAGVKVDPQFSAYIEDWSLKDNSLAESSADKLSLSLTAGGKSAVNPSYFRKLFISLLPQHNSTFGVDLQIQQAGPIVLQGDRGLSEKGPGSASFYYSIPRMEIEGLLRIEDRDVAVKGFGWLDREWSTSVLGEGIDGWDWFSLQLHDQRSIMAFRLRRQDGTRDEYDHGLLVDHTKLEGQTIVGDGDKGVKLLKHDDFFLEPTRYFEDAQGTRWPVGWTLRIGGEQLLINALLDEQAVELSIIYWEGLVEVLSGDGEELGRGYMELTGY